MLQKFFRYIIQRVSRLKAKRRPRPLINHKDDVTVLRRIKQRTIPAWSQLRHIKKVLTRTEKRIFFLSFVVFLAGIGWVGAELVEAHRVEVPRVGGRYVEAVVGEPELVNPLFASVNDVDFDISRLVYSGLLRHDEDERLLPDLAASYTINDERTVYTFVLRENVFWHDGKPFSARDVVFTFDLIQDEQVKSPLRVSFEGVKVVQLDDYTVQFTLQESFQPFLSSLTVGILPEHIWVGIPPERLRLTKINLQPVGTGPFLFKKMAKNETGFISSYELGRFGRFYRSSAYIEEVVFQFFGEYEGASGAIQAFREQKTDGLGFVPSYLREKIRRKHVIFHTLQLPQYTALFFNQKRQPILEDADVRLALAEALDKDRILRESINNEGRVIESTILPGFSGYKEDIEKTPYSLEAADALLDKKWKKIPSDEYRKKRKEALLDARMKELLASDPNASTSTLKEQYEAEVDRALDTELHEAQTFYRENDKGDTLSVELVTADTDEYRHAAQLIAGAWEQIGVRTVLSFVPPKELPRDVLKGRKYDVLLYGIIVGSDPDQFPFWHSSQVNFPGLNLAQYTNRTVDGLLEKIRETNDPAELETLSQKFQESILAERPAIFLYMPTYTYATTDKITGIRSTRIFHPADRFAGITDWYIKTKGKWQFGE